MLKFKRNKLAVVAASILAFGGAFAADGGKLSINIDAKSVEEALSELSKTTDSDIVIATGVDSSLVLSKLQGEYTLQEALARMLRGTGLTYEFTSAGLIVVSNSESEQSSDAKEEVEEIVVTGSLLKRNNPAQPITTLTAEDITRLGAFSAEDIIRSLPQNFSSVNAASSLRVFNNDVPGFFNPELQGNSTANLRGFGSDATLVLVNGRRQAGAPVFEGGAVNLSNIPVSAIERVEILNDGASSIYGSDAVAGVINFILKKDYVGAETSVRYENAENGGNRYAVSQIFGTYWDSGRLTATLSYDETRAVSARKAGWTTRDLRSRGGADRSITAFGQPGVISAGFDVLGALPQGNDGTNYTEDDVSLDNIIPNSTPLQRQLTSETKTYSIYVDVEQEVSDTLKTFFDVTYSKNKNVSEASAPFNDFTVPESNAFNKLNQDVSIGYQFLTEIENGLIPITTPINKLEEVNTHGGIVWDLPFGDWSLTATGGYSESSSDPTLYYFDTSNPDFIALLASSDPDEAFNFFGDGTAQSELISQFYLPSPFGKDKTKEKSLDISAEGALFELPGGEARFAVGGEYRAMEINYSSADSDVEAVNNPEQDVKAIYSELSLPLVGSENQLPAVKSLQMSFGVRWEENSFPQALNGSGAEYSHTSPRITLAWNPIDDLTLRATRSESFRSPLLSEIQSPTSPPQPFLPFVDPYHPGGPQMVFPLTIFGGGNPDLRPEITDTLTVGFDWRPTSIPGLEISVTYNKFDQTDRITSLNTFGGTPLEVVLANPDFAVRDESGVITLLNSKPINVASRLSRSVDFDVSYEFETDLGMFYTELTGTYTGELADTITEGAEIIYTDRTVNGPDQWRTRLNIGWSKGGMGADLFINHSNSYQNTLTSIFSGNTNQSIGKIEGYTTVDLTGYYNMDRYGLKFTGGVKNLFSTPFPFADVNSGMPFDTSRVDTRGRIIYLGFKKEFQI